MLSEDTQLVGSALIGGTALLSAYLLVQRFRESLSGPHPERPAAPGTPRDTQAAAPGNAQPHAASRADLDRLEADLRTLAATTRTDLASTHQLTHRNAEQIATLLARDTLHHERLADLHRKVDALVATQAAYQVNPR